MLFFHALSPAVGVFNDKIYVAGGANGGGGNSMENAVEVNDPVANTWSALQPMKTGARSSPAAALLSTASFMSSVGDGVFELLMRTRFMIRKRIHGSVGLSLPDPAWGHRGGGG